MLPWKVLLPFPNYCVALEGFVTLFLLLCCLGRFCYTFLIIMLPYEVLLHFPYYYVALEGFVTSP